MICQACQPWRLVPNYMSYSSLQTATILSWCLEIFCMEWQHDEIPAYVHVTTCADTSKQGYPDILYNEKIFLQVLILVPGPLQGLLLAAGSQ